MNRKAFKTCAATLATALSLLLAGSAVAQTPPTTTFPGDWPNLGAFTNRAGQNANPKQFTSGKTKLRWETPSSVAERKILLLDNTDFVDTSGLPGGPYSPSTVPDTGFVALPVGAWSAPGETTKEANAPYTFPQHADLFNSQARIPRSPTYVFTTCVPSSKASDDPTVPEVPGTQKYWEWDFTPTPGAERTYALYAWLPIGTTDVSPGVGGTPVRLFPQRKFVYEILFGNGLRYVDVVDTSLSGNGFVRLGGGGAANQAVFPFDGTNPIKIRLYNTVPRNSDGSLALEGSAAGMNDAQETNLASTFLVYADATRAVPQGGTYEASPVAATITGNTTNTGNATNSGLPDPTADWNVTAAINVFTPGLVNGVYTPTTNGTVVSYQANPLRWPLTARFTPLEKWRYSLAGDSVSGITIDDINDGTTQNLGGTWTTGTINPRHIGADYHTSPTLVIPPTNPPAPPVADHTATYTPSLQDGSYDIYAYLPGNSGTETYSRGAEYVIYENGLISDTVYVDQSQPRGWVRIGTRRYVSTRDTGGASLKVILTNRSNQAGDAANLTFTDALRFVSAETTGISSTPIHATVSIKQYNGTPNVDTKVVIVADESGKIHCLDAVGNGDGTTTEYWSYPSTPNYKDDNWVDPNLTSGIDGVVNTAIKPARDNQPTAIMPSSFNLSTAAVVRVGGRDLLYIGASNGRVYCIDMEGRGDYNPNSHLVGSAVRRWTYPDTYPAANTQPSALGAFAGSIVYGDVDMGAAGPTVFVPAQQGRMIALNAIGTPAVAGAPATGGTTTVRWQFPLANEATLPPITMTPVIYKAPLVKVGRIYFGTLRSQTDDGPGQFYSLRADTGQLSWRINGIATHDVTGVTTVHTDTTMGSFITGPVVVSGTTLASVASPYTTTNTDTIYLLNDNRNLYGLGAASGALITDGLATPVHAYQTSDLDVLCDGSLTYTVTRAYDRNGALREFPVIVVPSNDGRMRMAFARLEDYNVFNGYLADGLDFPAPLRDVAAANNFLFAADTGGSLYALDELGSAGNNLNPALNGDTGVNETIPPNDPRGAAFRGLKVKIVNKLGYVALRDSNPDGTGKVTYQDAITNGVYDVAQPPAPQTQLAFEWGQTAYILVYGFPYAKTDTYNGNPVPPPQVNLTLSVEGRTVRQVQVDSRQFANPTSAPPVASDPGSVGYLQDGYAIVPFTFQNAGSNTLPPGPGRITASISTASLTGQTTEITQDIRSTSDSRKDFIMANPLALQIESSTYTAAGQGISLGAGLDDPYALSNQVNGSPVVGSDLYSQMLSSAGFGVNGGSQTARVYVYDRSLMALVRPGGIENVRIARTNLARQGVGKAVSIVRLLDTTKYPNFEDTPVNFPNLSLDYPDIGREQVRAIKDPNGGAENPLLTTVSLRTPLGADNLPLTEDSLSLGPRKPQATTFDMVVDVPRYQPPVNVYNLDPTNDLTGLFLDQSNNSYKGTPQSLGQGYFGKVWAYVDSTGDAKLNTDVREAYRSFNLSVGVQPQLSILTGTPNVDLGSLAAGTGYSPNTPVAGGFFDPWNGIWKNVYKEISVRNDSNVNLTNLRVAKMSNDDVTSKKNNLPWPLVSKDNDPLAWFGGSLVDDSGTPFPGGLWSNIDAMFATPHTGGNDVILPKPRVTDRVPTELVANPYRRANPLIGNLGNPSDTLNKSGNYPSGPPKVAVAIPLGFPVGSYASQIQIVEDRYDFIQSGEAEYPESLDYFGKSNGYDAYSSPITLTFKVRETRMTNSTTPNTAAILDPTSATAPYRNAEPAAMRDAFGSLVVAWVSDRLDANGGGTRGLAYNPTRIYFGGLSNLAGFGTTGIDKGGSTTSPANNAPLWDLTQFQPATAAQWFNKAAGYPGAGLDATLFPGGIDGTTSYGSPSFPAKSQVNPLDRTSPSKFNSTYMGFVGESLVQTPTGRISQSRIFASVVSSGGGAVTPGAPIAAGGDPQTAKGKPSVVQLPGEALFFYSETSAGQTGITVSRLVGTAFANPVPLNFGDGFSSVFSPSAFARPYVGSDAATNANIVELSFAGKLRGRPNAEVYLGRLRLDTVGGQLQLVDGKGAGIRSIEDQNAGSPFMLLPQQSNERLLNDGNGVYRARGVHWNRTADVILTQTTPGAGSLNLLVLGTGKVERQSGLISFDCRLGGKVYLDPDLGSVKFVGATPGALATLRLTYTPTFLRVTPGGTAAGYSSVNGFFDDHYTSEYQQIGVNNFINPYWYKAAGVNATPGDQVRSDRFVFAYGRGGIGTEAARPYMTSMRLGIRLPSPIATNDDGTVKSLTVTGNTKPYQVDPVNGRVYFQAEDEDRLVSISYTGMDIATRADITGEGVPQTRVSFVLERDEVPVLIDEAKNDSSLTAFPDPFTYPSTNANDGRHERPPLYWLFYVSTRAGRPDLYFQTIAPRYLPFAK